MKSDIVILGAVAAILGILFFNSKSSPFEDLPSISPNIIQVIIEAIQKDEPWMQPVETIYITPKTQSQAGVVYEGRFLFLDTRGFYGVQYDVGATLSPGGNVTIVSKTASSAPDRSGPFQSYAPDKYQPFADVQADLSQQLGAVLQASRELPPKQVQF